MSGNAGSDQHAAQDSVYVQANMPGTDGEKAEEGKIKKIQS